MTEPPSIPPRSDTAPPRGPVCRCGCTWVEHALHVLVDGAGWYREGGACLTCSDCARFEAVP